MNFVQEQLKIKAKEAAGTVGPFNQSIIAATITIFCLQTFIIDL